MQTDDSSLHSETSPAIPTTFQGSDSSNHQVESELLNASPSSVHSIEGAISGEAKPSSVQNTSFNSYVSTPKTISNVKASVFLISAEEESVNDVKWTLKSNNVNWSVSIIIAILN